MSILGGRCPSGCEELAPKDCVVCRLVWTLEKVREMREAQKAFFAHRDRDVLARSKELEKVVDAALARLSGESVQQELF